MPLVKTINNFLANEHASYRVKRELIPAAAVAVRAGLWVG
jgi:hypothetical protein